MEFDRSIGACSLALPVSAIARERAKANGACALAAYGCRCSPGTRKSHRTVVYHGDFIGLRAVRGVHQVIVAHLTDLS